MNRKLSIGLLFFIIFLIFFDAVQQKYYIESFGLQPDDTELSLTLLLSKHFVRWLIWAIVSAPFMVMIWKKLLKYKGHLNANTVAFIILSICFCIGFSLTVISIYEITDQEITFGIQVFQEFLTFFVFQKGLTFLMASITVSLILYNQSREQTIESQLVEITDLKRKSTDLEEALSMTTQSEAHLNIKTGNRFQPVALSEVVWIQSDDYCVKIHTRNQAFTLRKSMKALEEELRPYGFIRVHRVALLNINFLQQVNFDSSTIQLSNTTELPLSRTGAKALKRKLEQSAV